MYVRGTVILMTGLLASLGACGGPSEVSCAAEAWEGMCTLRSVTKIREAELPAPHVVLEVIHTPQENPRYPNFTPPELRDEIQLLAKHEFGAREHLERNSPVACRLEPPPPGSCVPGKLSVRMPAFDPAATPTTLATAPSGCAKIESQATQDQVRDQLQSAQTFPEIFSFERGSSQISSDASAALATLAERLKSSPNVECLAIVGQTAVGETLAVANDRARSIKEQLVAAGIDGGRLMTIAVTQSVFGTGTAPPPDDPNQRRVTLRVLLTR